MDRENKTRRSVFGFFWNYFGAASHLGALSHRLNAAASAGQSSTDETFYSKFKKLYASDKRAVPVLSFEEDQLAETADTRRKTLTELREKLLHEIDQLRTRLDQVDAELQQSPPSSQIALPLESSGSAPPLVLDPELKHPQPLKNSDSGICLNLQRSWSATTTSRPPITAFSVNWDCSRLLTADQDAVCFWDLSSGVSIGRVPLNGGSVTAADVLDEVTCVIGLGDGGLSVRNVDSSSIKDLSNGGAPVSCLRARDFGTFISGSANGFLKVWDVAGTNSACVGSYSPSAQGYGRVDSGGTTGAFVSNSQRIFDSSVWDSDGEMLQVCSIAIFPDNASVVAAGHGDGSVYVWDTRQPSFSKPVTGALKSRDGSSVCALAWDSQSRGLVCGTSSGAVNFWDWRNEVVKNIIQFDSEISSLSVSSEHVFIASRDLFLLEKKAWTLRMYAEGPIDFVSHHQMACTYGRRSGELSHSNFTQ